MGWCRAGAPAWARAVSSRTAYMVRALMGTLLASHGARRAGRLLGYSFLLATSPALKLRAEIQDAAASQCKVPSARAWGDSDAIGSYGLRRHSCTPMALE